MTFLQSASPRRWAGGMFLAASLLSSAEVSSAFSFPSSVTRSAVSLSSRGRIHQMKPTDYKRSKRKLHTTLFMGEEGEGPFGEGMILEDADCIGEQLAQQRDLPDVLPVTPSESGTALLEAVIGTAVSQGEGIQDVAEKLVVAAMTDQNASECVAGKRDEPLLGDFPEKDAENVGAILAATEMAAAAAEASLSSSGVEDIPLIPNHADKSGDIVSGPVSVPDDVDLVPASSVVGDRQDEASPPDVKKILTFAIPAIGVWLCGPLLSLIDTSAVGLLSGTAQQAALNPAVAVTDYAALLMAFLYTATTNLVAAAQETDRGVEGKPRTTRTLITSLQLSGFVGAGLGAVLIFFARSLLRSIIGNDAIDPLIFSAAMKYVRIRALGMPAAAIIGSAQAACLGMQDIRSPLYVLAAAATVNFLGDMMFVGSSHPLIGGAAGAAWATVFSQYAALAMFLKWLCNKPRPKTTTTAASVVGNAEKPKVVNLTNAIMELTGPSSSQGASRRNNFREALSSQHMSCSGLDTSAKRKLSSGKLAQLAARLRQRGGRKRIVSEEKNQYFSARGFLEGQFHKKDLVSFPTKESTEEFLPYVLPVTTTSVGRVSSYVAMSHVVSSSFGAIGMAAQQVIVSLFYCLCPIADSLSLTAQSFVPTIFEKEKGPARARALRQTALNFIKAGAVFGLGMVAAVACIPFLSRFFTTDLSVVAQVNAVAPLLAVVFAVHGIVCAAEGVLLGQKDLGFLGKSYAAYFAAVPWLMLRVKRAALSGADLNLTSVWKVFLGYQLFRVCAWIGRLKQLQGRTDRELTKSEDSTSRT